jgi:hypothetical protein
MLPRLEGEGMRDFVKGKTVIVKPGKTYRAFTKKP